MVSDIFVSYASEDRVKAESLARILERQGWSVWWDRNISAGKVFDKVIQEALDTTRCVVVLWSQKSVNSRWVRIEAEEGARRNILIPVLIKRVKIPLAFRSIQAADLTHWDGATPSKACEKLMADISGILLAAIRGAQRAP